MIFLTLLGGLFLIATVYILAPWWTRNQQQKWIPLSLVAFLLIFASAWYGLTGRAEHIWYAEEDAALQQIAQLLENTVPLPPHVQAQIVEELQRQELRTSAQPTVWLLQAQLAMQQKDYTTARTAYAQAYKMTPDDPEIAISYAQTWYLVDAQQNAAHLSPELKQFLRDLQQKYPEQDGLINLLGVVSFQSGDYNKAIQYWQELLSHYPNGSAEAQALHSAIEQAQQMKR